MTDKHRARLAAERRRLESASIADDDRELLEEFDRRVSTRASTGPGQHGNCLGWLRIMATHRLPPDEEDEDEWENPPHGVALAETLEDEEASRTLDDWIEAKTYQGDPIGGKTKLHYRGAIRLFGRVMTDHGPDGDGLPPAMRVISTADPRDKSEKDPTPKPGEISWWDPDVIRIIDEGCYNPRDQAIVAVGWDSGARPSEVWGLTWGDISEEKGFYKISVGGKDHPYRDPLIVVATPYLKKWLKREHPANDRPEGFTDDTPIWTRLDSCEAVKSSTIQEQIRKIRGRVDYDKPFTLKWLRKSRASIIAMRPGMSQTSLENRFGWVRGSQVAGHYIARFTEETDADVAVGDGLPEDLFERETDERDRPAPVRCPNCEDWTPRHMDQCLFCPTEFATDQAEEVSLDRLAREEERLREKRARFLRHFAEDEVTADELDVAVRFGELLDGNEEAIDAAEALRDVLEDGE